MVWFMYLENLIIDAVEPQRLGTFWEEVVGGERITDELDIVETRLTFEGGPVLDLCFPRVPETPSSGPRLHLDLRLETGEDPDEVAAGTAERGGRELHPGWGELPWRIYADP